MGAGRDTSASIGLHLQTVLLLQPKENSKSQNRINLGYGQLTCAVRRVILSWGSWLGGHPQLRRDLTSCDVHMRVWPGVSPGFCLGCPGELPFHLTWDWLTRPSRMMHGSQTGSPRPVLPACSGLHQQHSYAGAQSAGEKPRSVSAGCVVSTFPCLSLYKMR